MTSPARHSAVAGGQPKREQSDPASMLDAMLDAWEAQTRILLEHGAEVAVHQRLARLSRSASPLVGEVGASSRRLDSGEMPTEGGTTASLPFPPTPSPSPQGGGEALELASTLALLRRVRCSTPAERDHLATARRLVLRELRAASTEHN